MPEPMFMIARIDIAAYGEGGEMLARDAAPRYVHTSRQSAEVEAERLANRHDFRQPSFSDDSPKADAEFDLWLSKAESMQRTARRKARDPQLERDTTYSVLPVMVMQ